MSKAEDLAKELFPLLETDKIGNNPYITYNIEQLAKQKGFVEGYRQAERDVAEAFARIIRGNLSMIDQKVQTKFELLYTDITREKMYKGFKD